jgi:PhnO protein
MKIRAAKKSDYKELMRLYDGFIEKPRYSKPGNDSFAKVMADPNTEILVAEEKGELIGFISFRARYVVRYKKPIGEVEELFVSENYRKQGIGGKLIKKIEQVAKKFKCQRIYIESRFSRKTAHKFYVNLGYKKFGYYFLKK